MTIQPDGVGADGLARALLTTPDGRPVLRFLQAERSDAGVVRPWADLAELASTENAIDAVLDVLDGWVISGDESLGAQLVARGGTVLRHALVMSRDLSGAEPATAPAPMGTSMVGLLAVPPVELLPSFRAAYPPAHPDHDPRDLRDDESVLAEAWAPYLTADGPLGPPIPNASLCLQDNASGAVIAAVLVNEREGTPPYGGPWVTYLHRDPDPRWAGAGVALLTASLHALRMEGRTTLGLAVTAGNPAVRVYERSGFTVVSASMTVLLSHSDSA